MSEVVDIFGDAKEHYSCPRCGNVWLQARAIVIARRGASVEAFAFPLVCIECDTEIDIDAL